MNTGNTGHVEQPSEGQSEQNALAVGAMQTGAMQTGEQKVWRVRHEGSPRSVQLSLAQVLEGLRDGQWEGTDEVFGPSDMDWIAIENHPLLEEAAWDLEPRPRRPFDEGTHLDMNALIDVCLVLLIFFILTTSYAELQRRLEAPGATADKKDVGVARVTKAQIEQQMIYVTIKIEAQRGQPVIRVEGQETDLDNLVVVLRGFVRQTTKTTLLIDHERAVVHDLVTRVIDKAKGAGLDKVLVRVAPGT